MILLNYFLKNDYNKWYEDLNDEKEEPDDSAVEGDEKKFVNIQLMPLVTGDEEEVKEGKGLKILIPNKLLTRLPVLLEQTNAGNNSYKLKKLNKYYIFCINRINSPKNVIAI